MDDIIPNQFAAACHTALAIHPFTLREIRIYHRKFWNTPFGRSHTMRAVYGFCSEVSSVARMAYLDQHCRLVLLFSAQFQKISLDVKLLDECYKS
jgi:hypothetical protein